MGHNWKFIGRDECGNYYWQCNERYIGTTTNIIPDACITPFNTLTGAMQFLGASTFMTGCKTLANFQLEEVAQ